MSSAHKLFLDTARVEHSDKEKKIGLMEEKEKRKKVRISFSSSLFLWRFIVMLFIDPFFPISAFRHKNSSLIRRGKRTEKDSGISSVFVVFPFSSQFSNCPVWHHLHICPPFRSRSRYPSWGWIRLKRGCGGLNTYGAMRTPDFYRICWSNQ